jgi:hypothetical protein
MRPGCWVGKVTGQMIGATARRSVLCPGGGGVAGPWRLTTHLYLVKLTLSLCLTKYHTIKTYPVLSQAPHHEDVVGNWRYCSTLS